MKKGRTEYTALISRNFRNVDSGSPIVLLRNVTTADGIPFRDHCWVDRAALMKILPRGNKSIQISFMADTKLYKVLGPEKETLTNIHTVKRIK